MPPVMSREQVWLQFHQTDGKPVVVRLDKLWMYAENAEGGTGLFFDNRENDFLAVRETPEQVTDLLKKVGDPALQLTREQNVADWASHLHRFTTPWVDEAGNPWGGVPQQENP